MPSKISADGFETSRVQGDRKNICVRAHTPIDFVIIYKNERNANKWIFDERGEPKSAYTANRCAAGDTKAGGKPNRCTYMDAPLMHLCTYRVSQNCRYIFI